MVRTRMTRTLMTAAALAALSTANAAVDDAVRLDTGMVSGIASATPDVRVFKGIPFAAPPHGRSALACAEARRALGRRPQGGYVRPRLHAGREHGGK